MLYYILKTFFALLLLFSSFSAHAQESTEKTTEKIEASTVAAISIGSKKSFSNKSHLLVSRNNRIYLKFDLPSLPSSPLSAQLHFPIRSKSSGLILIKESSINWSEESITGKKPPTLARSTLERKIILRNQRKFKVNIKSALKEPGIYSFALVGKSNSAISIRTLRGKAFPYIRLVYTLTENGPIATATATPTATITPTQIPIVSGISLSRGPYLQRASASSMIVRWSTDLATSSAVYYGKSETNLEFSKVSADTTNSHRIELSELTADTTYYYRIGNTAGSFQTPDSSQYFATSPVIGTNKATRIWVLGDSGTSDANARAVRDSYLNFTGNRRTDVWLMLGDNAYNSGTDSEYQSAVFDMYPSVLKNTALWPTLGNHDATSADSSTLTGTYYDIFSLPRQAQSGGIASGTEAYYAFDYGQIHFVCLDSIGTDRSTSGPMLTWLRSDLAAASTNANTHWIIAFWHHPPYSKGSHDSDIDSIMMQMRERALPILEDYGVDLVLTGHSHSYERSFFIDGHYGLSSGFNDSFKKMAGGGSTETGGIYTKNLRSAHAGSIYIVAGSSGKLTAAPLNHPAMYTSQLTLGSVVLDINENRLDAQFINSQGTATDVFSINKNP